MKHHGFQRLFALVCNCSHVVNRKDKQELKPLRLWLKFSNSGKLIFSCFTLLLLKNSPLLLLSLFYIARTVAYRYSLKDTDGMVIHVTVMTLNGHSVSSLNLRNRSHIWGQRRPAFALPYLIPSHLPRELLSRNMW